MYHNATMPTGAAPEGLPQPTVSVTQGCQDPFEHAAQEFELSDKPKAARRKRVQNPDIDSDCYIDTGVSTAAEHSCAALPRRSASMQGHLKLQITAGSPKLWADCNLVGTADVLSFICNPFGFGGLALTTACCLQVRMAPTVFDRLSAGCSAGLIGAVGAFTLFLRHQVDFFMVRSSFKQVVWW